MIRTLFAMKLLSYCSLYCWLEQIGSMRLLVVRCLRLSLQSVNGCSLSINITRNHRLSSPRRLNLPKKKEIFKLLRKSWLRLKKSWESSLINWTNLKKILRNNWISRTNLSLKPWRLRKKLQLLRLWLTHYLDKELVGKREQVKYQMRRKD